MKLWLNMSGKRKAYPMKLDARGRLEIDGRSKNHVWGPESEEAKKLCILQATDDERSALKAAGFQIPDCSPERIMGHRGGSATGPEKARGSAAYYRAMGRRGLEAQRAKRYPTPAQPSRPYHLAPKSPSCPTCGCEIDLHDRGPEGEARCPSHDRLCGWIVSGRA